MAGPLSIARRVRQLATRLLPATSIARVEGLSLEVDPRTEIGRTLWRGRPFEARERELAGELLRAHHGEDRAIVDVGAHVGLHALTWARRFPRARVIAIEPSPEPARGSLATSRATTSPSRSARSHSRTTSETATSTSPTTMATPGCRIPGASRSAT